VAKPAARVVEMFALAPAMADKVPVEPTLLIQVVLCFLASLEGADNSLLGASSDVVMDELNFGWIQMGWMGMAQGVASNLCGILWGSAADRGLADRKYLLMGASVGQGVVTVMLALLQSYGWFMIFLRIMNGLFLSGLRPITNGVIADKTDEEVRGKIFARAQCAFLFGMSFCNYIVVRIAAETYQIPGFGEQRGWRVAWIIVGAVSVFASILCASFFPNDLKEKRASGSVFTMLCEEVSVVGEFLRIPTFWIMLGQGVFGTIPWSVMWIMTRMYLAGGAMDRDETALVTSLNPVWGIFGTILGGYMCDFLASKYPNHGRALGAQISVASGIPIMYMNFIGVHPADGGFWIYLFINAAFGVMASWPQGGTNFPTLSEIVPADKRSRVLAVEGALENSVANVLAAQMVPLVSRIFFGFDLDAIGEQEGVNVDAARAIGYSLGVSTAIPWLLCYLNYSLLHWTIPMDVKKNPNQGPEVSSSFFAYQYKPSVSAEFPATAGPTKSQSEIALTSA